MTISIPSHDITFQKIMICVFFFKALHFIISSIIANILAQTLTFRSKLVSNQDRFQYTIIIYIHSRIESLNPSIPLGFWNKLSQLCFYAKDYELFQNRLNRQSSNLTLFLCDEWPRKDHRRGTIVVSLWEPEPTMKTAFSWNSKIRKGLFCA